MNLIRWILFPIVYVVLSMLAFYVAHQYFEWVWGLSGTVFWLVAILMIPVHVIVIILVITSGVLSVFVAPLRRIAAVIIIILIASLFVFKPHWGPLYSETVKGTIFNMVLIFFQAVPLISFITNKEGGSDYEKSSQ